MPPIASLITYSTSAGSTRENSQSRAASQSVTEVDELGEDLPAAGEGEVAREPSGVQAHGMHDKDEGKGAEGEGGDEHDGGKAEQGGGEGDDESQGSEGEQCGDKDEVEVEDDEGKAQDQDEGHDNDNDEDEDERGGEEESDEEGASKAPPRRVPAKRKRKAAAAVGHRPNKKARIAMSMSTEKGESEEREPPATRRGQGRRGGAPKYAPHAFTHGRWLTLPQTAA